MTKAVKAVGKMYQVYNGTAKHTSGGLKKKDIIRRKVGVSEATGKPLYRYVSKKKHDSGSSNRWIWAVGQARDHLGVTGFVPIRKGTDLYKLAKAYHESEE